MSKNEPLKTKENGIVGKPAEPTSAPGGSAVTAAWVAGAGAVGVLGADELDDDEEDEEEEEDEDELPFVDVAALAAADVVLGTGPVPLPAETFSDWKSIRAPW